METASFWLIKIRIKFLIGVWCFSVYKIYISFYVVVDSLLTEGLLTDGLLTDGLLVDGLLTDRLLTDGLLTEGLRTDGLLTDGLLIRNLFSFNNCNKMRFSENRNEIKFNLSLTDGIGNFKKRLY